MNGKREFAIARGAVAALLLAIPLVAGSVSFPDPAADDNGHAGFVRQAVPALLGRRARGMEEIEVLADLAELVGREAVVRVLMDDPEFVDHWSSVLLDMLRLQREGRRRQEAACFDEPLRTSVTHNLAAWVRSHDPRDGAAPGGAFNMADVVGSAIVFDDLSPAFRAYLFPLAMQVGREGGEIRRRRNVGRAFLHEYLTRQLDCLGCHGAEFSTSGAESDDLDTGIVWNRTHPLPFGLDRAIFGNSGGTAEGNVINLFRSDVRNELSEAQIEDAALPDDDRIVPWGIHESCVRKSDGDRMFIGFREPDANDGAVAAFAALSGNDVTMLDLERAIKSGKSALNTAGVLPSPPAAGDELPDLEPEPALAYAIAASIVDQVWEAVMGERLTIANYFPRNVDQRDVLWHLTEDVFIANNWSLKQLLVRILSTNWVNRRAPMVDTALEPYTLPMVIDPWVAADPRRLDELDDPLDPAIHYNGQGEIVRRHTPRTLLYSVSAALDWPAPRRFAGTGFPSRELMLELGQYYSQNDTGTGGVDFQGLLTWEAGVGVCENRNPGNSTDWIDRLISQAQVYNADNPSFPLGLNDLIESVKDWLIQDATIDLDTVPQGDGMVREDIALAALFGVPLNTPMTLFDAIELKQALRGYCGVLLRSPQFMLAGIEPKSATPLPRLRVCNGSPCTYAEMCEVVRGRVSFMGHSVDCVGRDIVPSNDPPNVPLDESFCVLHPDICGFCPQGRCGHIVTDVLFECLLNPERCTPRIPRCDPRCYGPQCCGGPIPVDFRDDLVFLGYWERAKVLDAEQVLVRPLAEDKLRPLESGQELQFGDVVVVEPGARLAAEGRYGGFATPKRGMPARASMANGPLDEAMLDAAAVGKTRTVEALFRKGASVHAQDAFGRTPLLLAVEGKQPGTVKVLLKLGADVLHRDGRGVSALGIATLSGQRQTAALLTRAGAFLTDGERKLRVLPEPRAVPWIMLVTGPSRVKADTFTRDKRLHRFQVIGIADEVAGRRREIPYEEQRKIYLDRLLKRHAQDRPPADGVLEAFNKHLQRYGPVDGVW